MDICDIRKANMISSILWPVAHNPEINWEKGEVKMVRCLVICGQKKEEQPDNEGEGQEKSKGPKKKKRRKLKKLIVDKEMKLLRAIVGKEEEEEMKKV